ncbi:uncharacterized protein LOC106774453 isoform X2 [Vigna radiata var. radiata]|uniref:Uncharacterized protein LOC106774453 isoform X2 n=1 Tax=Vigna radiata var. radiata TaxID=3916 RepID=A0A3Q0F4A4_VIGRR|nr:uncharacterized protein LOC106774453 isoform X2 [Vigna radiata var. radiata]
MFMVPIKMGPDNLSTRKNAAIYSEIGLDVSPSSSLDDSPSESEGISCDPHEAPFESPTIILQETHKVMVREKTFSSQGQKEGLEPTSTEVNGFLYHITKDGKKINKSKKGRLGSTETHSPELHRGKHKKGQDANEEGGARFVLLELWAYAIIEEGCVRPRNLTTFASFCAF